MATEKVSRTSIAFSFSGQRTAQARSPGSLAGGVRSVVGSPADELLDCVKPVATYDLSATARATTTEKVEVEVEVEADAGQVIALELEDGFTLITSPDRLDEDLRRLNPELPEAIAPALDGLRDRSPTTRGAKEWSVRAFSILRLEPDAIYDAAAAKAKELGAKALLDKGQRIASWAGTKALMWAIERKIGGLEGLHRWLEASGKLAPIAGDPGGQQPAAKQALIAASLESEAARGPLLVFIHGTASNGPGSFGDLHSGHGLEDWADLREKFGRRIFAFEHRTFSESPIANALDLARSLPARARLHLVAHSRGGLIGDLLCLPAFEAHSIESFRRNSEKPDENGLAEADAKDREDLLQLGQVLAEKRFEIQRYVRIACPSRGSLLLSAHFDAFLSALLNVLGLVPGWSGNPLYSGFKRIVLEVAKNRTQPELVPGIEAMLPESPLTRFLELAPKPNVPLAVIAGDIEGESLLKRVGVFLTDSLFFEHRDNDLIVETDSMFGGIARIAGTRYLFEQGRDVSHFRYLANRSSRRALKEWVTADDIDAVKAFTIYADDVRKVSPTQRAIRAAVPPETKPAVFVIPGIMGSHLRVGTDRVWFDFLDLARGGLEKIAEGKPGVAPDDLFDMFYGDLCDYLEETHAVHRFPYDWRESIFDAGGRLAVEVDVAIRERQASGQPVRLLAHSMGGLVVRAMIARFRPTWDRIMQRKAPRFVMLGTPNRGAHLMVETLLGKGETIRQLARLDIRHDLEKILEIVSSYRGALELLPNPALRDAGGQMPDYFAQKTWQNFKSLSRDSWFQDNAVAVPAAGLLEAAKSIWADLPEDLPNRGAILYVAGQGANTPCGVDTRGGKLRMIGTPKGDGSVTWESGLLDDIESWYMPGVPHGELADTEAHFAAILELLTTGTTLRLPKSAPALRGGEQLVTYDAGPVLFPTEEEFTRGMLGARPRGRVRRKAAPILRVVCRASDLRFAQDPVLVGHYQDDAVSGAEAQLDRVLGNALSMRKHLGLYAGPVGSATILLPAPSAEERAQGLNPGAVVIGLGVYGTLTNSRLCEAVRSGTMRYLLQWVESHGGPSGDEGPQSTEIGLTSLLIGYNSTTNLSIEDSVYAVVRGVAEANQKFAETMDDPLRIGRLEFVECYLDTAISAARALRKVAERLQSDSKKLGIRIDAETELMHGEGVRQRLDAQGGSAYWPRLVVTDAARKEDLCPAECYESGSAEASTAGASLHGQGSEGRVVLAERLRFVYLGQRARAETVVQQRQPRLVETLVEKAIRNANYRPEFSRTLFQLLVPYDFKEAARQADRLVLVLDGYTANLPWEMISGDDKPLAIQTPMIRQLASSRYRIGVRSGLDRIAYVVGNPSTQGFNRVFGKEGDPDPDALPGAEAEAQVVAAILQSAGFELEEAPGGAEALDVINKLYARPYRILHIAAHGIYDAPIAGGEPRSGVVLSDGLLLTAAEIGQMETVPDLVFLNCCFLGKVDRGPVAYNRLAYSVARELIEMGVRGVIVAGWAVDDAAGKTFAEVFYDQFLRNGLSFGEAVFRARVTVYESEAHQGVNTWGAYQAYGDPGFLIDPMAAPARERGRFTPVSPEELLDRIESLRTEISWSRAGSGKRGPEELRKRLEKELRGYPGDWCVMPAVQLALGRFYADVGGAASGKAIDYLRKALAVADPQGRVPLCAVEQLAYLEIAEGRRSGVAELLEKAIRRLSSLFESQQADAAKPPDESLSASEVQRYAALGSACEYIAALRIEAKSGDASAWLEALRAAEEWFGKAEHDPARNAFDPGITLHWLQLRAVIHAHIDETGAALTARCAEGVAAPGALIPLAAKLTLGLLDGSMIDRSATGERFVKGIVDSYRELRTSSRETSKVMNATAEQFGLLARFFEARTETSGQLCASRLRRIAEVLKTEQVPIEDEPDEQPPGDEAPTEQNVSGAGATEPVDGKSQQMPKDGTRKKNRKE